MMKLPGSLCWILSSLVFAVRLVGAAEMEQLVLLPEMQKPEGIVYESYQRREELRTRSDSNAAMEAFRSKIVESWPQVTSIDWAEWSRYQVEATRGWHPPKSPGELSGQVVGRDDSTGRLFLEFRGPRLPASHEIVYRYLYFYSTFDPGTRKLGPIIATIRGWVLE